MDVYTIIIGGNEVYKVLASSLAQAQLYVVKRTGVAVSNQTVVE